MKSRGVISTPVVKGDCYTAGLYHNTHSATRKTQRDTNHEQLQCQYPTSVTLGIIIYQLCSTITGVSQKHNQTLLMTSHVLP